MNALRVMMIVLALAIFGCAGVERKCVEDKLKATNKDIIHLERMHSGVWECDSYPVREGAEEGQVKHVRCEFKKMSESEFNKQMSFLIRDNFPRMNGCFK